MRHPRPSVAILATALLSTPTAAQDAATNASTAPPSTLQAHDLSIPVLESAPPGGWHRPTDADVRTTSRRRAEPGSDKGATSALPFRHELTTPLFSTSKEHEVWVRTETLRVCFDRDHVGAYPVFGPESPREWPVELRLDSVRRGDDAYDLDLRGGPHVRDRRVEIDRVGLREIWHVELGGVEQTFVLEELPGVGDLVVALDVVTDLEPVLGHDGDLTFVHAELGGVRYGDAFAIDAGGERIPIEREWDGRKIVLRVPHAFLADAALPVTIDPPVTAWSNGFGASDDMFPDVAYSGGTNEYFICWQEYTSAANSDVYITSVDDAGVQGSSFAVEITNDDWRTPRVAYVPAGNRLLVVASVTDAATGDGSIQGQMVAAGTRSLSGGPFFVSTLGSTKLSPDVGGTNLQSTTNNHFLVAWSRVNNALTNSIERRVVHWNAAAVTSVEVVALTPNEDAITPAVSDSLGDSALSGDWWTLAWIRDTNNDGRGQVWARRIPWNGNLALGSGNFLVNGQSNCRTPSVTSRFDDVVPFAGDRPSVVAYERLFNLGQPSNPVYGTIFANVVFDGQAMSAASISAQEDFDSDLDQFGPAIATNGDCFMLAYSEEFWLDPDGGDFDTYMVSGHLAPEAGHVGIALAERHQRLGFTFQPEYQMSLAMAADGLAGGANDDGFCVWTRELGATGGHLIGSTLDCNTLPGTGVRAVGVQYCAANPHAASQLSGNDSSWLWILGDQSVGSSLVARCVDMPPNTFGYLIASLQSGNVDMPGGSRGRLCLGGSIGRYVAQVANSGTDGTIDTTIDPGALPRPTGNVSATPGETWYFQVWHRDTFAGSSTSNFSNACSVAFTN